MGTRATPSKACTPCRIKHRKCDLKLPGCSQCHRARIRCPGYLDDFTRRLFDETSSIAQKVHARKGRGKLLQPPKSDEGDVDQANVHDSVIISPSRPPISEAFRLATRWASLVGEPLIRSAASHGLSEVYQGLPARLGNARVLDAAATYGIDCQRAFIDNPDALTETAVFATGTYAIQALRLALGPEDIKDADNFIPSAMMLLMLSEYVRGYQCFQFQFHALALCKVLRLRWSSGQWGPYERFVLHQIVIQEVVESVCADTISELDDLSRFRIAAHFEMPHPNNRKEYSDFLYDRLCDVVIQIPRLAKLVRRTLAEPFDEEVARETLSLVAWLYSFEYRDQIEALLATTSGIFATRPDPHEELSEKISGYLGAKQNQQVGGILTLGAIYCMQRMCICGTISRLLDSAMIQRCESAFEGSSIPTVSLSATDLNSFDCGLSSHTRSIALSTPGISALIEAEDLRCAMAVKSTVDSVLQLGTASSPAPPWMAVRVLTPNSVAYGTWTRLRRRAEHALHTMAQSDGTMKFSDNDDERDSGEAAQGEGGSASFLESQLQYAKTMQTSCLRNSHSIMTAWKTGGWPNPGMTEKIADAFTGGPPLKFMSRRGAVRAVQGG